MKATTMEEKVETAVSENVKEPIRRAFRKAARQVDALTAEGKQVADKVETRVRKATAEVRAKGEEIAKDPKGYVQNVVGEGKKRAQKVTTGLSQEASRIAEDVTRRVSSTLETAVERTLHRFNVPTHNELQRLTAKVDTLNTKIDAMRRTNESRAKSARAAKPARKTAARKTTTLKK